jgi:hypothetical protein
VQANLTTKF